MTQNLGFQICLNETTLSQFIFYAEIETFEKFNSE